MAKTHERAIPRAAARPLWQNRDFMLLWSGQGVSSVGSQVSRLAFPLLILTLTRSPAQAGLLGALASLPYLLLSLLAGALVDRWDRRRVMIVCDSGRALVMATIPVAAWSGHLSIVQLYAVALVEGTLMVFFDLAEVAALPRVVGREQLPAAMAQNNAMGSGAQLLGQPLAGALYQLGRSIPFLTDAVSYVVSVLSLLFLRADLRVERSNDGTKLQAEIKEGIAWLWNQPVIRFLAFLNAGSWIALSGTYLVVIVLARQQHAAPATIGLILATTGVGGMLGSLLGGALGRWLGFAPVVIGGIWVWTLLWPLYAVARTPLLLAAVTGAIFLVFPIYNVVQMTYRMVLIPDALQGRVNSAFRLISFTGQPISLLLTGASLQLIGARGTVLAAFAWLLLLATAATLSPYIRHAPPLGTRR